MNGAIYSEMSSIAPVDDTLAAALQKEPADNGSTELRGQGIERCEGDFL